MSTKKAIYEQDLKTPEYVVYNPITDKLQGWRLKNECYQAIKPNKKGWLWCEELELWIGIIEHNFPRAKQAIKTPRFFAKDGQLILTRVEDTDKQVDVAKKWAETSVKQAKAAEKRAEVAVKQAEIAEKRAEAEAQARSWAEAEIARLKALLEG